MNLAQARDDWCIGLLILCTIVMGIGCFRACKEIPTMDGDAIRRIDDTPANQAARDNYTRRRLRNCESRI